MTRCRYKQEMINPEIQQLLFPHCHSVYNASYPGAGPAQESKGIAIHRWWHQVHAHCPPAPVVPLSTVETSIHLAALQTQDHEALCKVVHGLKPVAGKLRHIKGGGLVVTVEQDTLVKRKERIVSLSCAVCDTLHPQSNESEKLIYIILWIFLSVFHRGLSCDLDCFHREDQASSIIIYSRYYEIKVHLNHSTKIIKRFLQGSWQVTLRRTASLSCSSEHPRVLTAKTGHLSSSAQTSEQPKRVRSEDQSLHTGS